MPTTFKELHLDDAIIKSLHKEGIITPTQIQYKTIPLGLEHKDVIGQSFTGSGKTLSYLLPIFQKVNTTSKNLHSIILAPTHELAMQIHEQIRLLSKNSTKPVLSIPIIGRVSVKRQIENLKKKPHIIVGTPGRILELIKLKKLKPHTVKTIVIDEGDKLLDQNNITTIESIIKTTLRDRQLMVFLATATDDTITTAKRLMNNPTLIKVNTQPTTNTITHMYFECTQREKTMLLRKLIASTKPKKAIVFINKNEEVLLLNEKLNYHSIKSASIFGNSSKEERKRALNSFKNGKIQILIASDLAARGLDLKDVTHVFNMDIPEDYKEYLHRTGRTGRAGKTGTAISLVTSHEATFLKKIANKYNIKLYLKDIAKGTIFNKK